MKGRHTKTRRSRRDLLKSGLAATAGLMLGRCAGGRRQPNVVLVSIDTLRPDRLHCYGNPRATSPCIDQLAREGVLFRNAFSSSPWTLPAHLALFASRPAGKYFQSVGTSGRTGDKSAFPIIYKHQRNDPTIASVLRDNGYDTAGFHGAMLTDAVWGLDHGFRRYEFSTNDDQFIRASEYLRDESSGGQPFFLFVHTYVVHRPYGYEPVFGGADQRPSALEEMDFPGDRLSGMELTPTDASAPLYGWQPDPEIIDYFKTVYDGGVRAADQHLQGLIDTLKELSLYDDTVVIVLSDHGEEFWEHIPECSPDHNHSLFDELLRIPLILKMPRGAGGGQVFDQMAQIHDVGPTLFEMIGSPLPQGVTGRSLLPLLEGEPETVGERHLFAGCTYMGPTRYSIRTSEFKYIQCPQAVSFRPHFEVPPEALYDLKVDPLEQHNIVEERADVANRLRALLATERAADLPISLALDDPLTRSFMPAMGLEAHAQELISRGRGTAELPLTEEASEELLESLRSLGYL